MDQVASMFHPETYFWEELSIGTKRLKSCVGEKKKKKYKKQNILEESLLCSELQLLNTVALNHVHWGNSCSCLRCYCSSAVCYLPFAGWGMNTNLPQQFRLSVTLSNRRQVRPRHVPLSPSNTGECSSPCKRVGVGMGSASSPSEFL